MVSNYTSDVSEYIEDMVINDTAEMWADIALLDKDAKSEKWEAKLNNIAKEYLMSSRFALIRLLCERAGTLPSSEIIPELAAFRDFSMAYAQNLSPEEHSVYIRYLLDIAGPSPKEDPDLHERIILRAWHDGESANTTMKYYLPDNVTRDPNQCKKLIARIEKENKKRYSTCFTREEAFQLGHILNFTLEEMQWYLLRVFDIDDGFRMNRSSDIIEAYCFLTQASCWKAEKLKKQYYEKSQGIEKREDIERAQNWTRQTAGGLMEHIEFWKRYPESMDENFFSWLIARSSGLDLPSYTARRIYRNLAAYAYAGDLPPEEMLYDELLHISDMDDDSEEALEHLYNNGVISESKCQAVAEQLYWENKTITDPNVKDNTKAWSVITTRKDKELSVSYGTVNSSRTRIQSLLLGTAEVEKGDLLYLLWFTFNLVWSDTEVTNHNLIFDRVFDLKEVANAFLNSALLPPFYPPHLMEQSMLLSIVYAGKIGTDPSVIYGSALQSLRDTRVSGKKSGKHALQDKVDIIMDYRQHPEMTLKQCAEKYKISEQTISRWQKELTEQGYISADFACK